MTTDSANPLQCVLICGYLSVLEPQGEVDEAAIILCTKSKMLAIWPFVEKKKTTFLPYLTLAFHSALTVPPTSRSFPCCNRNERPSDPQMSTNDTSFEESLTWLWIHRRTRQCCCWRGDKKRRECYLGKASRKPR